MKALFILFLTLSFLQSDELQRIESIINDIVKLRVEHAECQRALESKGVVRVETTKVDNSKNYEKTIEALKAKNSDLDKKIQDKMQMLQSTKNEMQIYKKEVKTKEDEINSLKNQLASLKKAGKQEPKVVIKEKKIYQKDENIFPTLMPKNTKLVKENLKDKEIVQETKPTTYRLKNDSKIYSTLNEDEIYMWEKDRSFTSNMMTQNFIRITGFFINQEWQKANEELWIKKVDVFER